MSRHSIRTIELDPRIIRSALIGAQVLALMVYLMGAGFLFHTSGGTLFLFALAAPLLILAAVLALAGVAIYRYLRRNSLFAFALFEPGDFLVRQGDQADFAYFIQQGEVEVVRREEESETVIARIGEGQHFGETALISNTPHHATLRAATRVRVAMLGKKKFQHMLRFVHPAQEDIMHAVNQRARKQSAKRAKAAQIREDQSS
jgi:cyclic nucleotide-binding protein